MPFENNLEQIRIYSQLKEPLFYSQWHYLYLMILMLCLFCWYIHESFTMQERKILRTLDWWCMNQFVLSVAPNLGILQVLKWFSFIQYSITRWHRCHQIRPYFVAGWKKDLVWQLSQMLLQYVKWCFYVVESSKSSSSHSIRWPFG